MLILRFQRFLARMVRAGRAGRRRKLMDEAAVAADATASGTFDHSNWDGVLSAHVKPAGTYDVDGVRTSTVDYRAIARDARFDEYLREIADANIASLAPAEQLALMINAYNALCIALVVAEYRTHPDAPHPVASITDLKGEGGKSVWDRPAGVFCGRNISLGELEHKRLRGEWDEPGIHFCIVCASASCPDLRARAYVASGLAEQMAEQAASFSANETKGLSWDGATATLSLSKILFWFADDFGGGAAAAELAVDALPDAAPLKGEIARHGRRRRRITYKDYNWTLNAVAA